MDYDQIIQWLLTGDVSIQYQVQRDLLGKDLPELQNRIQVEGWGKRFLDVRNPNGHWILSGQVDFLTLHFAGLEISQHSPHTA